MSSHNTMKSTDGVIVRRVTEPPDPDDRLLEQVLPRSNMVSVKELWVNIYYPATTR